MATGIGLAEASRARLYQRFARAETATVCQYGGTGPGLATCKRLAELMGGMMDVASAGPGQGCTFRFVVIGPAAPLPARPQRAAAYPGMAARHPLRILLAEGNVVNQKLSLRLLHLMGYRADRAATGLQAVDRAVAVLHAGRRHAHSEQQSERVDVEMALAAFDLLARVVAR